MRYTEVDTKKSTESSISKRNKFDVAATVLSVSMIQTELVFIALVEYTDGEKRYIVAPNGIKVGQTSFWR